VPTLPKERGVGRAERRARTYRRGLEDFKHWLEGVRDGEAALAV
jgi:hypothetical protein